MTVAEVRTKDKGEAMAVLAQHLESPDEVYARMQHLDGEYTVEVIRPTEEVDDSPTPQRGPDRTTSH